MSLKNWLNGIQTRLHVRGRRPDRKPWTNVAGSESLEVRSMMAADVMTRGSMNWLTSLPRR